MNKPLASQHGANSIRNGPDVRGRFGEFGGRFVAETLMPLILEVERAYNEARSDPAFKAELDLYMRDYVGRPIPLWLAERLTRHLGGAKIYFKRDELNHTGSHKANNCMGQILLARRMGKKRIIAETGAGQHGVATATMCALFGLPCTIYMGATDVERQKPNVFRMKLLGAEVKPVTSGAGTLKDAMNEAMRDWVANVRDTYYLIGTVAGPHPYPMMVRDFQSVIGEEARAQMRRARGPAARCGGGLHRRRVERDGAVPSLSRRCLGAADRRRGGRARARHRGTRGEPLARPARRAARQPHLSLAGRRRADPGGAQHLGRARLSRHRARAFLAARYRPGGIRGGDRRRGARGVPALHPHEGIIPALEPAHALAHVTKLAPEMRKDEIILMNLCGRGDKDIFAVAEHLGVKLEAGVSRIAARFAALRRDGRGALIPFVEAWDPEGATSLEILRGMPGAGADLIEIGMPFTDPMADGPTIQAAGKRALKAGANSRRPSRWCASSAAEDERRR